MGGRMKLAAALGAILTAAASVTSAQAQDAPTQPIMSAQDSRPWMNSSLSPSARVALLLPQMTQDEKLRLVFGYFGTAYAPKSFQPPAQAREGSAGYVPGVPRLGIPEQWETDAGIGVATQGAAKHKRARTALPSNLAAAATWNAELAYRGGAMIGAEARASGFNVMLAGGVDLAREPRNGRNFEYGGEDPLLAGTTDGAEIAGIQSNRIISTLKHYAFNDQETDRDTGDSVIDRKAAHLSDLLAFQIAMERGDPGSVMCSYNHVNGVFACENPWLLDDVLRGEWGFKGYVMSDWGATHSTVAAVTAGLDQESGYPFDKTPYFGAELKAALAQGRVNGSDLDRMTSHILYAMFAHGLFDTPVTQAPADLPDAMLAQDAAVSRAVADQAIVLLKNDRGVLPLAAQARRVVVIGGHADRGVLAGGGSSLVYQKGGNAVPGLRPDTWPGPEMYDPSSPLEALRRHLPDTQITYLDGHDPAAAAQAARGADVALIFATQWAGESFDVSLTLKDGQDALIDAVAAANPRTVVVLETGGAVLTPWAARTAAVLEAWYPGTAGGEAIADVLTGRVDPSGHLPVSFPQSLDQLPHPAAPAPGEVRYTEGAQVGYKWYDSHGLKPAFAFGRGLSYTRFAYEGLAAHVADGAVSVSFRVRNVGPVQGRAVAQVYAAGAGWEAPRRLVGFEKLDLAAGQARAVTLKIDPRLLADYDLAGRCWRVDAGDDRLMLGGASDELAQQVQLRLSAEALAGAPHLCGAWARGH
jgi:beta-glucosidase